MRTLIIIISFIFTISVINAQTPVDTSHAGHVSNGFIAVKHDSCKWCDARLDSARTQSRQINHWFFHEMTIDEALRWVRRKRILVLPGDGAYRVMHDSAWKIK